MQVTADMQVPECRGVRAVLKALWLKVTSDP